ncbi:MAG: GTP pyrophosphokinase family protein [Ruminococcus sp.]
MDDKEFYLDAIRDMVPEQKENQLQSIFYSFLEIEHLYDSAIELVKAQLSIFDNEFSMRFQRNPIHNIESRIKTPQSIVNKLQRKGFPISPESARNHLMDIAGVRVICCYIDDIYALSDLLTVRSGFKVLKTKDYIQNPKSNGYRSFHMIVNVPVHMSTGMQMAPVEIQIRTIAMDFWASLEHQLHYKSIGNQDISSTLTDELKQCADAISEIDEKMQTMFQQINEL